jgi:hypothetical protein
MGKFSKLRELVTLAKNLEAEGRQMRPGSVGRIDRMAEAEGYRVKAQWLAGRISDEEYANHQRELLDAKQDSID